MPNRWLQLCGAWGSLAGAAFAFSAGAPPEITAQSAIVIDSVSGRVLWEKNPDESRFPASTTKIMTALLLLERTQPTDVITAPPDIEKVKESSMHLKPGEDITAADMVYAIMLRSANDGCYATAIHLAGSEAAFAQMMNERAKQIGCQNTQFNNASGLNDNQHTTTARDLALIAAEAMKNPSFRQVVRTWRKVIARGPQSKDTVMINHNKRLRKDKTCDGIKTGWTVPAGRCFVGSANRENWRVITVVLKSKNWQEDTKTLFDWSFDRFQRREVLKAGQETEPIVIKGGTLAKVPGAFARNAYVLQEKGSAAAPQVSIQSLNAVAPIGVGTPIALATVTDSSGHQQTIRVLSRAEVPASVLQRVQVAAERDLSMWWLLGGAGLVTYWATVRNGKGPRRTIRHG